MKNHMRRIFFSFFAFSDEITTPFSPLKLNIINIYSFENKIDIPVKNFFIGKT